MLIGYTALGVMPVVVRAATGVGWTSASVVTARFAISCAIVLSVGLLARHQLRTHNCTVLFWRGACGGAAAVLYYFSLAATSAATATVLNTTHSLWANVFAWAFLRQRARPTFWLLLAMALSGVWLVVGPSAAGFHVGELLGLMSGILGGVAVLTIKELRKTDNALTIFASFSVFGLLGGLCLLPGAESPLSTLHSGLAWVLLLGVGLISVLGQFLFTHGYRDTSIEVGTVLALLVPVVATLCGWLWLGEALTRTELLGGLLIVSASASTGLLERRDGPRRPALPS